MGIRIEGETEDAALGAQSQDEASRELSESELDANAQKQDVENGEEGNEDAVYIGEPPEDTSASSDEQQAAPAPEWAKQLRKDHRRIQRELADERRKNAAGAPAAQVDAPLGAPPTLESCGWDENEFRTQTAAFIKREHDVEQRKVQQAQEVERQKQAAQNLVATYKKQQTGLKVRDFEDAEDSVVSSLSEVQQNILLAGADNTALVVYALGKNPEKLAELAKITDPVRFAFAAGKLEKDIKVQPRKGSSKPEPETILRSSASLTGGGNSALDAARKKAEQSGDYTEVNRIKRQQKAAQAR